MNKKSVSSGLRIAVADDHQLILEGFRSLLTRNNINDIKLFSSAIALIDSLETLAYNIYIIDLELPDMNGFDLIQAIRKKYPDAIIIVNTIHDELWTMRRLVDNHVNGILFKSLDTSLVIEAINTVMAGKKYYCNEVQETLKIMEEKGMEHPTQREMEILQSIANGLTSKEMAKKFFISENTVEAHRKSLFSKLKVHNTADLIMKAIKRGYLKSISESTK